MINLLQQGLGGTVGLATMIYQNSDSRLALPFGPFLAFGALCYLFFGEELINWYFGLLTV